VKLERKNNMMNLFSRIKS